MNFFLSENFINLNMWRMMYSLMDDEVLFYFSAFLLSSIYLKKKKYFFTPFLYLTINYFIFNNCYPPLFLLSLIYPSYLFFSLFRKEIIFPLTSIRKLSFPSLTFNSHLFFPFSSLYHIFVSTG